MKNKLLIITLFILSIAFFWRVVFKGEILLPADFLQFFYPWKSYTTGEAKIWNAIPSDAIHYFYPSRYFTAESIKLGNIPLWNPYNFCGNPHIANFQSAVFYPFNMLFLFSPGKSFGYLAILHIFLAGFFMYKFLRVIKLTEIPSFLGAVVFMFSGWFVAWLSLPVFLHTGVWIPLIFLLYELSIRKKRGIYSILCGIIIGLQFLAGLPQISAYIVLSLLLYSVFNVIYFREIRKYLIPFLSSLLIGLLISSVQIFPGIELAALSQREVASYQNITLSKMPLFRLITFIIPNFFGNPVDGVYSEKYNYTEYCVYLGIFPLLLIFFTIFNKKNSISIFFLILMLISLLLIFGTPLYYLVYHLIPGFKMLSVRRFIFLYTFSAAVLSGMGMNYIFKNNNKKMLYSLIFFIIFIFISFWLVFTMGNFRINFFLQFLINDTYTKKFLIIFLVFTTLILLYIKNLIPPKIFKVLILLFILYDIFTWGIRYNPSCDREMVYPEAESIEFLVETHNNFRIQGVGREWVFLPNSSMIYGLYDIRGYDSLYSKKYQDYVKNMQEKESNIPFVKSGVLDTPIYNSNLIDFLSVKYILTKEELNNEKFTLIYGKDINIYENKECPPRLFFTDNYKVIKDDEEILSALQSKNFNPKKLVILDEEPNIKITENNSGKNVIKKVEYLTNRIKVKCSISRNSILVMSDAYYPGWKVYIDGNKGKIIRANYAFRAIPIKKGIHNIDIVYKPISFIIGFSVSILTLFVILIILKRQRHQRQ